MGPVSTLYAMPDAFAAGTTVKYTRAYADHPASGGWALTVYIAGAQVLSKAAAANGDSFDFTLTATETATLTTPGVYQWEEWATKDAEKFRVAGGTVQVTANLSTATPGSAQSMNEKLLAAIDAVIAGRITDDVLQYNIHGRGLTKMSPDELRTLRNKVAWDVARERNRGRATRRRTIAFTGTERES
jgi:hypothetical protein